MPTLRITANKQHQFKLRQLIEQPRPPARCTLRTWRQIGTFGVLAWIAETHRDDCYPTNVIKFILSDVHPIA